MTVSGVMLMRVTGQPVESESLRVFVAAYDGYLFGSGWSRDE